MASNFRNNAGTDLDDLFYTDNGNAGALGYRNSSRTDLGNKYTDKSVLGYAVGYKNSAKTDMGYLRGDKVGPTITSMDVEVDACEWSSNENCNGGENPRTCWSYGMGFVISFKLDSGVTNFTIKATGVWSDNAISAGVMTYWNGYWIAFNRVSTTGSNSGTATLTFGDSNNNDAATGDFKINITVGSSTSELSSCSTVYLNPAFEIEMSNSYGSVTATVGPYSSTCSCPSSGESPSPN